MKKQLLFNFTRFLFREMPFKMAAFVVLTLLSMQFSFAQSVTWTGGTGGTNSDFLTGTNWSSTPLFNNTSNFTIVSSPASQPVLGSNYPTSSSGVVHVNIGATLTTNANIKTSTNTNNIDGTINVNAGSYTSRIYIGTVTGGNGVINVATNATLTGVGVWRIGNNSTASGTININGGTFNIGEGTTGTFSLGHLSGATGILNINSGIVNVDYTNFGTQFLIPFNGVVNIDNGSMVIPGDKTADVQAFISANKIVAASGKVLSNTYDGTKTTVVAVAVNSVPVAVTDAISVAEGGTATSLVGGATSVLTNDTDADSNPLTAVLVSGPANGNLTLNTDGTFSYAHNGSETTTDSFTYKANDGTADSNTVTVNITVTPVNDAPVANADTISVAEGGTATTLVGGATSVLTNDTDADSNPLTAVLVSGPANGNLTLNTDGTFSYAHNGSETTTDSFTYKSNDGTADGNVVVVNITVTPVNDVPVAVADAITVAESGTVTTLVGGANTVLANDTDGENNPLTAILVSGPTNGNFTLNTDGTFSYAHNGSVATTDSFTYKANDGTADSNTVTVNITINPVNDAPVAVADAITVAEGETATTLDGGSTSVLANDTDAENNSLTAAVVTNPANGSLTLNPDGTFSYVHNGSETTTDSFTYKANDGTSDSNIVTVNIAVSPVNDAPVAIADAITVAQGGTATILNGGAVSVLANDTDAEGNSLTAVVVANPINGSLTLNPNGTFSYTHNGTTTTIDSFTYKTNDGGLDGNTVTVSITVSNDPPPTNLNYITPNEFTKGTAITALNPTVSGGAVVSYSVNPALPAGLSLNTTTGVISGTPTAILVATDYVVTATNVAGSTTATVSIKVKDIVPSGLSYNTPNEFTKGTAITALNPTVGGGAVVSYSVNPALPAGLSLNTTTGVISGTPTVVASAVNYTVTATNTGGSTNFTVSITVNDIAPSGLSYNTPNEFTKGTAITALNPTVGGGAVVSYTVNPLLPTGLSLDISTGVISGTPTLASSTSDYVVTATNGGGSTNFTVSIKVKDVAPSGLSYTTPNVFTKGTAITALNPTVSGGTVVSYSVNPALPAGLSLNTSTGVISGTPTVVTSAVNYTVTATNTGGSTASNLITITVNDIAPSGLSYTTPNVFTKGTAITALNPTVSGGTVVSYSVNPALPAGLSLNTSTGVISGTPTVVASAVNYTVTATNTGGSTASNLITITVNDIAPAALSYTTPNVFTKGTAITALNPTVSGGTVVSYSVNPALPAGLSLNTSTGVISGTPTVVATANYTVTATNTGGSTASNLITITVNDIAPSGLSYTTPNVFTKGTAITALNPTVSGGTVVSYSVNPALPAGLSLNTSTGVISGTPTVVASAVNYTVTATNTGGSTASNLITITVNDIAPAALSYTTPNVFTKGTAITALNPTVSGGTVVSYSVNPALPAGLSLNTTTGVISGTPTAITVAVNYTVTATNTGGSTTSNLVSITVNDIPLSSLSYTSTNVFTKDEVISVLNPTLGGGTAVSYNVAPALPAGLSLDTTTGVISGTPIVITAEANYTVTATNAVNSISTTVAIRVNDVAPADLSYEATNIFKKDRAITPLNPTVGGGAVVSYSISPSLLPGLSFDTTTGIISGTPTVVSHERNYTITATNTGGSTSFELSITVLDISLKVGQAFTPNGDGVNDYWIVPNVTEYPNSIVRVFNSNGVQVFHSNNYQNDWNGRNEANNQELPVGSYLFQVDLKGDGTIDNQGWLYIAK